MGNPLMTSLDEIAKHDPCYEGWDALLSLRGHDLCLPEDFKGDDTLFNVSEIGRLGKLEWLCWTAILFSDDSETLKIYRWFALWCAENVKHRMKDENSIKALDVCRDYLEGTASKEQLSEAETSAYEASTSNHSTAAAAYHGLSSSSYSFYFWTAPSVAASYSYSSAMAAYHAVLLASCTCSFLSAPTLSAPYSYSSPMYDADKTHQINKLMEALDSGSYMSLTKESLDKTHAGTELDIPSKCLYAK